MKKVILPLLLILAIGILAAVESEASAVVGYVKYTTTAGPNIIALPMTPTITGAKAFGMSFSGAVTSVSRFNNATKGWQTVNRVSNTVWTGTDFTFIAGDAVRIVATAAIPADFYSIGDLPNTMPSWDLSTGPNYLSLPLNKSSLSTTALLGANLSTASSISRFNNTTKAWQTTNKAGSVWMPSFAIGIGDPLRVVATTNFTWPSRQASDVVLPLTISK